MGFVWIEKNDIKDKKFYLLERLCKIQKKSSKGKFGVSKRQIEKSSFQTNNGIYETESREKMYF